MSSSHDRQSIRPWTSGISRLDQHRAIESMMRTTRCRILNGTDPSRKNYCAKNEQRSTSLCAEDQASMPFSAGQSRPTASSCAVMSMRMANAWANMDFESRRHTPSARWIWNHKPGLRVVRMVLAITMLMGRMMVHATDISTPCA